MEKKEDVNWTQRQLKTNLEKTMEYVHMWGGWAFVLGDREGFETWLASTLGCRKMKAAEYISILRGSIVFEAKMRDLMEEKSKTKETEKQ